MAKPKCIHLLFFSTAVFLSISGCGDTGDRPKLGQVSGTVTFDGEPLVGSIISFKPDIGRAAAGLTDAYGRYRLEYVRGVNGAKIGPCTVSFSWPTGSSGAVSIPEKYGPKSELKEVVASGNNTFDFDLESDPKTPSGAAKKKSAPD